MGDVIVASVYRCTWPASYYSICVCIFMLDGEVMGNSSTVSVDIPLH